MNRLAIAALLLGALVALAVFGPMLDADDEASSAALGAAEGTDATTPLPNATTTPPPVEAPREGLADEPPVFGPAPDLVDLDGWLQTDATQFADFDGQVRVVQFWTFSCFNCKATIPHLQDLYADAGPRGLEIIGVHAPEFDRERDPAAIAAAATDLGVTWPIALDTDKTNFRSWQGNRRFWPRTYVIDQEGQIRFDHIGEGDYDELAATVDWLLANPPTTES